MSTSLLINSKTFEYPDEGESPGYGEDATDWATEITNRINTISPAGSIDLSSFTVNDADSSTSITGFSFDSSSILAFFATYTIKRGANVEAGRVDGIYDGSDWIYDVSGTGDSGYTITVNSSGQVLGTSSTANGSGTMQFRATTIPV